MTRKRYVKLMTAASTRCHEANKARGPVSYKPGRGANYRDYRLPPGMSYAEVWARFNRVMRELGINVGP